jgi:hypothetical protein
VPWLPAEKVAVHAARFAASCYSYQGKMSDEAPLMQLLQYCSAALQADIAAVALPAVAAAADADAAAMSGVAAASSAAGVAARADTAVRQPAAALEQAPAVAGGSEHADGTTSAGQTSAEQPGAAQLQQQPQQHDADPQPEWESNWMSSVATALKVHREHLNLRGT